MFIVFDAIDGAGKGEQREQILSYLSQNSSLELSGQEFPVHNIFYESVIHPALQEETTLNSPSWVLSFLLDKTMQADEINKYVGKEDNLFIADGYFTTTIAYQSLLSKQVPLERLLGYAEDFEIPKPDLAIFIDADPQIAFRRKEKEEGHDEGLDMFEKDIAKQEKLRSIFEVMFSEQIYCKWDKVDGNGTIDEVKNNIIKALKTNQIL